MILVVVKKSLSTSVVLDYFKLALITPSALTAAIDVGSGAVLISLQSLTPLTVA